MNNKQEKEGECDVWRDLATHQCFVLGIIILLTLIIGLKLNTFISLIITSMITALLFRYAT